MVLWYNFLLTFKLMTKHLDNIIMKFEWNKDKNKLNQEKHGVSFEEAKEVFADPLHISKLDYRFSYFEERWITIGATNKYSIRLISARKANQNERKSYEKC